MRQGNRKYHSMSVSLKAVTAFSIVVVAALVLATAAAPATTSRAWQITAVELPMATGADGQGTSIAVDSSGNPRIAFYDMIDEQHGTLNFAWSDDGGATWPAVNIRKVDAAGDAGLYASLALDSSGNPHISYCDRANAVLKYARSGDGGATWPASEIRTLDNVGGMGDDGQYTSIALDPSGNPRISYYDAFYDRLKFTRSDDGGATWPAGNIKVVDADGNPGVWSSLAVDNSGNPRISYYNPYSMTEGDLKYAWSDDGGATWPAGNIRTVEAGGDVGAYNSLALDASGDPAISYHDDSSNDLKFTWSGDGGASWPAGNIRTVDGAEDVGYYSSLARDASGDPRIAYYDGINRSLKYARSDDGGATWPAEAIKTVDSDGDVGKFASLALDPSGNPHISYQHPYSAIGYDASLKYARSGDGGATWPAANLRTVEAAGDVGYFSSLARDASGNPHVSYYDWDNCALKYARSDDGGATWPAGNIKVIASGKGVGASASLALDASGNPQVSYYDQAAGTVKYTRSQDGGATWPAGNVRTVGSVGVVLTYTSLQVDPSGNPRIAYYDQAHGDLKYARSDDGGATWPAAYIRTVDSRGDVGGCASLALDASGTSTIAYYDWDNNALKYARSDDGGTTWPAGNVKVVDTSVGDGHTCSISLALDPVGNPRVSYYDYIFDKSGSLKFARSDDRGATWPAANIRTVDSGYDMGNYNSLALDASGDPRVSYSAWTDETHSSLKYARSDDGGVTWAAATVETVDSRGAAYTSLALDQAGDPGISYYGAGRCSLQYARTSAAAGDSTWYLAEGSTAWGFDTYLTVENPNAAAVRARLTYMDPNARAAGNGTLARRTVTLPAFSQTTINPREDIGIVDFSTRVECLEGFTIAVDRTMTWTSDGGASSGQRDAVSEAHNSIGTTAPAATWYLPEGSSAWGFETWTLVENPNSAEAKVTLTYMTSDAGPLTCQKVIPAYSRASYSMAADIGSRDSSVKVASDLPVIAESSQYRHNRGEGSCSIGAVSPANDFYLAEGTTAWGFTTFLLIQNPSTRPAPVTVTYQTPEGPVRTAPFTMNPNSRTTIKVNEIAGLENTDTSVHVHSSEKMIASRSMYWNGGPDNAEACHGSIGLASPARAFYLPDGQISDGHQTYVLVQNPNASPVSIRVTCFPENGGKTASFDDVLPANTRRTYDMAGRMPAGRASVMVKVRDAKGTVMVERSMYWNNRGVGTETIGAFTE